MELLGGEVLQEATFAERPPLTNLLARSLDDGPLLALTRAKGEQLSGCIGQLNVRGIPSSDLGRRADVFLRVESARRSGEDGSLVC